MNAEAHREARMTTGQAAGRNRFESERCIPSPAAAGEGQGEGCGRRAEPNANPKPTAYAFSDQREGRRG